MILMFKLIAFSTANFRKPWNLWHTQLKSLYRCHSLICFSG